VRVVKALVWADFEAQQFEAANEDYAANSIRLMQLWRSSSGPAGCRPFAAGWLDQCDPHPSPPLAMPEQLC